jgi:TRAP-type C4-dicarboxylate transport system substrate-binding protein
MKKKKSLFLIGIAGLFAAAMFFTSSVAMADPIILKYSDPSSPNAARAKAVKAWGDWIEKETGNEVKIEYYWSKSLAKPKDNIKATKGGIADMAMNSSFGYHKTQFPIWQFSELLMLGGADWGAHSRTVKEMYETMPVLKKEIDKTGLKLMAMIGIHPTHFMTQKPIRKLEDFKGMRIRSLGSMADFLKSIGASPVGMTIYETYEAMQKGIVDGAQSYMYVNIPFKLVEVSKYAIVPGIQNITMSIYMNKKVYGKLPAKAKKVIDEQSWDKMLEFVNASWDESYTKSVAGLKKAGIEFIEIDKTELARWKKAVKVPVYDKWLANMKKKGVDGQAILDKYAEVYKKYQR